MNKNKEEVSEALDKICATINEYNFSSSDMRELIVGFLYSVGNSLEGNPSLQSSEMVLQQYASKPTFGRALMAQALWMKETWSTESERKQDVRGNNENERSTTVQDLQGSQGEVRGNEAEA